MDTEKIIDTTTYLYFDWKKIWWLSYHWHNSQHHVLPTILSSIHVPLKLIFFLSHMTLYLVFVVHP